MTFDDIKKLSTGSLLFSLDRIIAPRLVTILYLLGLFTIVLWAINHLFANFALGFGEGLWGLLEVVVYGLLGFVALRIVCEALIVYFRTNASAVKAAQQPRPTASLIDEVRGAIEELAEEDREPGTIEPPAAPRTTKAASAGTSKSTSSRAPRRTARRTPPKKS